MTIVRLFVIISVIRSSSSSTVGHAQLIKNNAEDCDPPLGSGFYDTKEGMIVPQVLWMERMDLSGYIITRPKGQMVVSRAQAKEICEYMNMELAVIDELAPYYTFVGNLQDFNKTTFFGKITTNTPESVTIPNQQCGTEQSERSIRNKNYSSPLGENSTCEVIHFENNSITLEDNCEILLASPLCSFPRGSNCFNKNLQHQREVMKDITNKTAKDCTSKFCLGSEITSSEKADTTTTRPDGNVDNTTEKTTVIFQLNSGAPSKQNSNCITTPTTPTVSSEPVSSAEDTDRTLTSNEPVTQHGDLEQTSPMTLTSTTGNPPISSTSTSTTLYSSTESRTTTRLSEESTRRTGSENKKNESNLSWPWVLLVIVIILVAMGVVSAHYLKTYRTASFEIMDVERGESETEIKEILNSNAQDGAIAGEQMR